MAGSPWAIDLGTTHTRVARWDAEAEQPRLLELPAICRQAGAEDPLEAPRLVPSATHVLAHPDLATRLGRLPFISRRFFLGREAFIGKPAADRNLARLHPNYAPSFKLHLLAGEAMRPLVRAGRHAYTARQVARIFLRELLAEIKRDTGERPRAVTFTTPVDAYETYRAELLQMARGLGIEKARFVDEPVAAALGYGVGLAQPRRVLVVDFGGGTLHLALACFSAGEAAEGTSRVLAKTSRAVGGGLVDRWLLEECCKRLDYPFSHDPGDEEASFWFRQMLDEARQLKESLFFRESSSFRLVPPVYMRRLAPKAEAMEPLIPVRRDELVELLRGRGLYRMLEECLGEIEGQCSTHELRLDDVDDVLMVGGSTLLPNVYPMFEERFGRNRVRAWQPFEAVAFGACAFAAETVTHSDFIVHDYAFVTYDPESHEPEYTVIVPRGTRFPTPSDLWKRQLVPTCSLGEPESMFKLVICEIGRANGDARRFLWDDAGQLHKVGGDEATGAKDPLVVRLNESSPTLGYLDPPHSPGDKRPRLEIAFGVNEDRWLAATVLDLRSKRHLMRGTPVVRLL